MQRICVRLRGIFTSNQTFYMSASLQAAAFVWSVIYVQLWQKHFFMESLKNLYFGKKKKKGGNDFFRNRASLANSSVM